MKKIYLFLFLFITVLSVVGQEVVKNQLPYATYKEGMDLPNLKSGNLSKSQATAFSSASTGQIDVLLLSADDYAPDVVSTLVATGRFNVVDLLNYVTPTVATLKNYDAVLVWADSGLDDTIGDTLATYIDGGGGVVSAVFNLFTGWGIEGTRFNSDYLLLNLGNYTSGATTTLGTVHDASHPIMEDVTSLVNPNEYRSNNATITVGSVVVAEWSDGLPLVVIKENVGPSNARRADVNLFPPSSTIRSDFWDASTDGGILLANALFWVSKAGNCPGNIVVDNDSASCGAVVEYIVTAPEKGSFVQTAGLPTGTEFPVGTTTNCFLLTDSLGVETTCCFTVTVNDTEAPVAVCATEGGEIGKAAYVISTQGKPWGQNTNEQAMDMAFGSGNWDQLYYETLDVNNLLSNNYDFVFMEGGDNNANEMEAFVDANISAMETWVANGGNLFLNAAPNEGDGMDWGFWGVQLQYGGNTSSGQVEPTDLNHPIFTGPFTPLALFYTGNSFAHAIIPEELNVKVLINDFNNPDKHVLTEIEWGTGKVFFGGMTTTNWHQPLTEALNLRANMLHYLGAKSSLEFQLDNTGTVTITPDDIDGGSFDNCGSIAEMELDRTTFTIGDLGEQDVTLTVTDAAGNSSSCTTTITIVSTDKEEPSVVANPLEVYLDETGKYVFNQLDLEAMAEGTTDNKTPFEELKLVAYPKIFVCENIGEIIHVRLTVEDEDGNRARQWTTVTVLDTLPPMAVCRNIDVYLDENGQAVITPEQVNDTTSYDACGIESITLEKDTFSCTDLGENMVTLYVTDLSGNVGTCAAMVMVYDTLPPTAIIVADIELEVEPGLCETAIEYPAELIADNCNFVLEQTAGLGPDGIFPLGTTTETWLATDDAGNIAEISFNVIITATNALPTLDAVADIIADEDTSPAAIELTGITYGIDCAEQELTVSALADNTDLVSGVTVEYIDGESTGSVMLTIAPDMNGTTDINVTVEDSEGAMVSQTFTVTVNPVNDAPIVVNPIPDQVVIASGVLKIPISPELGIVFDDADNDALVFEIMEVGGGALPEWAKLIGDTLVCTPMIADTGYYNMVIKATDPDGANATDTFTVHVDGYPVSSQLISESGFDVKMYPNPTNDRVNIEINTAFGISDVSVYTITGKEIMRRNFYDNHIISFSMRDNVSGIYLVKMNVEGKQIVKKLVLDKK